MELKQQAVHTVSQHVKEIPILGQRYQQVVRDLVQHFRDDQTDLEPSQLYSRTLDRKFIDEQERVSMFKTLEDGQVLDLAEELVTLISDCDELMDYSLVRNNVTFIKYEQGGFFKTHEDYLTLTSNFIEEYTLLICADAACKGGETLLHINEHHSHASRATVTPLHGLLFRKDINHEGALIEEGYKEILSLNLLAIPVARDQIVVVSFPDSSHVYVLPLENVMKFENIFAAQIRFKRLFDERIIRLTSEKLSYDEFENIYRILMSMYVDARTIKCDCFDDSGRCGDVVGRGCRYL